MEYLDDEDFLDGLEDQVDVVAGDGTLILDFFEEEIEAVVAVFAAVFGFFEEGGEEGFLFGVVDDGVDCEIFE